MKYLECFSEHVFGINAEDKVSVFENYNGKEACLLKKSEGEGEGKF